MQCGTTGQGLYPCSCLSRFDCILRPRDMSLQRPGHVPELLPSTSSAGASYSTDNALLVSGPARRVHWVEPDERLRDSIKETLINLERL